jgi:hypothetical protein
VTDRPSKYLLTDGHLIRQTGLLAPKGIPAAVGKKLEVATLASASMSDVKEKFAAEGFDVVARGHADFTAYRVGKCKMGEGHPSPEPEAPLANPKRRQSLYRDNEGHGMLKGKTAIVTGRSI